MIEHVLALSLVSLVALAAFGLLGRETGDKAECAARAIAGGGAGDCAQARAIPSGMQPRASRNAAGRQTGALVDGEQREDREPSARGQGALMGTVPVVEVEPGTIVGAPISGLSFTVRDGPGDTLVVEVPAGAQDDDGHSLATYARDYSEAQAKAREGDDPFGLAADDARWAREAWAEAARSAVDEAFELGYGRRGWNESSYSEHGWHPYSRTPVRLRANGSAVVTLKNEYTLAERARMAAAERRKERYAGLDGAALHAYDGLRDLDGAEVEHGLRVWRDGSWESMAFSAKDLGPSLVRMWNCNYHFLGCLLAPPLNVVSIALSAVSLALAEPAYELWRAGRWLDRGVGWVSGKVAHAAGGTIDKVGGWLGF